VAISIPNAQKQSMACVGYRTEMMKVVAGSRSLKRVLECGLQLRRGRHPATDSIIVNNEAGYSTAGTGGVAWVQIHRFADAGLNAGNAVVQRREMGPGKKRGYVTQEQEMYGHKIWKR